MKASSTQIIIISVISFYFHEIVTGLYCTDIRASDADARFSVQALKTLSDEDLISCLVFLGKAPLGNDEGNFIWERLTKIYDGVSGIPESDLQQLGWIARAVPVADIRNLTIGDADTVAAFGQYHNLSQAQLQALAEQVRDDWASKEPTDYTFYDLMALKHILCGFNRTALEMIHPDSYREAAGVLATIKGCAKEALQALAGLAKSDDAFGEPATWRSSQTKSVGCVLNGFPREDIATIPPEGIESLTPDIMPCLDRETLKAMTSVQLLHLTPSAVAALSPEQKSSLSAEQRRAVDRAYEGNIRTSDSNGAFRKKPVRYLFLVHLAIATNMSQMRQRILGTEE